MPGFKGKVRIADWLGRRAVRGGKSTDSFDLSPGAPFEVNLNDQIQRRMWAGCYEPHVRACIEALLQPGDVFLDVGANVGFHAAVAAYCVGREGRVFAFEPDPQVYEHLRRNAQPYARLEAVPCAVWERSGPMEFERSIFSDQSGWGTLTAVRDLSKGEHVRVQAVSLDDWQKQNGVDHIDLIKMDAQGSEAAILRGASWVLNQLRPLWVIEIDRSSLELTGSSPAALVGNLSSMGYCVAAISRRRITAWEQETHGEFSDSLCVPEEKLQAVAAALARAGILFSAEANANRAA